MSVPRELLDTIRREVRALVPGEPSRETAQFPPTTRTIVARTGAATWDFTYAASDGDLPEAATPAWVRYEGDTPTAVVADGLLTVTVP